MVYHQFMVMTGGWFILVLPTSLLMNRNQILGAWHPLKQTVSHRHDGRDGLVDHLGRSRDHPASKPRWFWGDFETPAYQPWPNVANEITNKTFQIGVITVISKL